jgi:hypothetical protein
VEIITFVPLIALVILFKKTKSRHNRLKKFKKMFKNENNADFDVKLLKMNITNLRKRKVFKFPWPFKIILYLVSLLSMGFSILFVLFKGLYHFQLVPVWIKLIFFSIEKVLNWANKKFEIGLFL